MSKVKKMVLSLVLVCTLLTTGIVAEAITGAFMTTGGTTNKRWDYSLSSRVVANAFYRLTGSAEQYNNLNFDSVGIEVILYRNQLENVVKTASKQNTYSISAYADASIGTSGGYGTMLLVVVDDTYGHGTKRVYN
ncbi:MAG: hypothetical protein E7270_10655 [Lachnospiraceae bacterium]|nr:hypothetical protein [Lachnospiraceae bacterium]